MEDRDMTMRTRMTGVAVVMMALGGAAAADSHGHGGQAGRGADAGHHDMMQNMMGMHSRMMGGGMDMMQGKGGGGMSMMHPMMGMLDADGDGTVTPAEARDGLQSQLAEYDADGDGTLSLSEFETLHSAIIRESMVDRFQFLDDDGDGQVTADEIVKPADRMERMQAMRERMMQDDGRQGAGDRGMMGDQSGGMMDDD